ncbi:MAG: chromate transporter [Planctomycetes bacterium]|nr:chromate transporter [Planctomycetota bacterium]
MYTLLLLGWVFLKVGFFCWGGGIVIIPLAEEEVVFKYGWLTPTEFVDAVTLGQVSPGPVVISTTFIGYKVAGLLGAIVATVSVILPGFILMCLATQAVTAFRNNRYMSAFFHGARAAVIAMIFQAALSIGNTALVDVKAVFIAVISLVLLTRYKLSPIWLIFVVLGIGIIT